MVRFQEEKSGDDDVQDKSKLIAIAVIVLLFALFLPTLIRSAKLLSPEVAPKEKSPEMPAAAEQAPPRQDELQKQLTPQPDNPGISQDGSSTDETAVNEKIPEDTDDIIPEDQDKIMPEDEFNINLLDFIKIPE